MRFDGKVVMISGAASGFGRLAAERFAQEGARLSLSDIDTDGLAETKAMLGDAEVLIVRADVSQEADQKAHADQTAERFGTIDIALNNAGAGGPMATVADTTAEEFDRLMAINARGVFLGMKYQLPHMLKAGKGAILNTSSAAGLVGAGMLSAYAASKHAVIGLTRAAADEYARFGIRINAICPSFAITPLFDDIADQVAQGHGVSREDAYKRFTARIPMRRVAEPEEIVQAMLWIVDDQNSFMTGQAVSIDGGLTAV